MHQQLNTTCCHNLTAIISTWYENLTTHASVCKQLCTYSGWTVIAHMISNCPTQYSFIKKLSAGKLCESSPTLKVQLYVLHLNGLTNQGNNLQLLTQTISVTHTNDNHTSIYIPQTCLSCLYSSENPEALVSLNYSVVC